MHKVELRISLVVALAAAPFFAPACSSGVHDTGAASGGSSPGGGGAGPDASASAGGGSCVDCPPDSGTDAGCTLEELPLIVDEEQGEFDRLHAKIAYEGEPAVLLVDTGSANTFFQEPLGTPDPVANAALFQLGCVSLEVIGRPVLADPPVDGIPSIGLLGTDLLLQGPTEIDMAGARIRFHQPGAPFGSAASWPSAPFDVVNGAILVHVTLDDAPVHLMIDTGSEDTLWIGQGAQPGDVEVQTTDAYGDPITCYEGSVSVGFGSASWTAPVLRCPTFPSYEPPAPDVVGLFGLSSLGDAVVFDTDAGVVRVDHGAQ